jgi:hypothetical protein
MHTEAAKIAAVLGILQWFEKKGTEVIDVNLLKPSGNFTYDQV